VLRALFFGAPFRRIGKGKGENGGFSGMIGEVGLVDFSGGNSGLRC